MILDVTDIYGKLHYFAPNYMCSIDEIEIEVKGEIGLDGKTKKITVFEVNLVNGKSFIITEEERKTFMTPQPPKDVNPGDIVEEGVVNE